MTGITTSGADRGWLTMGTGSMLGSVRLPSFARSPSAALLLALSGIRPAAAQSPFPQPVPYRDSIVARIRDLRTISTPTGIDTQQRGDDSTLKELRAPAPYPSVESPTPLQSIIAVRRAARMYNNGWYGRPDFKLWFALPD